MALRQGLKSLRCHAEVSSISDLRSESTRQIRIASIFSSSRIITDNVLKRCYRIILLHVSIHNWFDVTGRFSVYTCEKQEEDNDSFYSLLILPHRTLFFLPFNVANCMRRKQFFFCLLLNYRTCRLKEAKEK